jgi:hypothetical protein
VNAALETAVRDVLFGTRIDSIPNRRDDGLLDYVGAADRQPSEAQVSAWADRLHAALPPEKDSAR